MEELYLRAVHELDGCLGYLMVDKFASHTLRVLLAVLAGLPLARTPANSLLRSKRKENVSVAGAERLQEMSLEKRAVPDSFKDALEKFVSQSISGFDSEFLQSLSMHQTGNPTLQLLLQIELTVFGKAKAKDETSIVHKLLPDDPITEDSVSGKFINSSVYDTLGSRLLETIIEYCPGKLFKSIYRQFFRDRIATLARNDIASYVVCKILNRLSKEDLAAATDLLVAQMQTLVERNRTVVIKTLVERCAVRGVDPAPIAAALEVAYGGLNGFDITHLLKLGKQASDSSSEASNKETLTKSPAFDKQHGSLLAQTMISVPGPLSDMIFDSLARLGTSLSLQIARDHHASHTVQAALTALTASVIFRRKMIQQFYGHIGEMALDPSASHVIDAIWVGTHGLAFIRERIAEELAEHEAAMRQSHVGRSVWRNWKMDLYKRRRKDWVVESRASAGTGGFLPFPEEQNGTSEGGPKGKGKIEKEILEGRHLTAIERARLKHAQEKVKGAQRGKGKGKRGVEVDEAQHESDHVGTKKRKSSPMDAEGG